MKDIFIKIIRVIVWNDPCFIDFILIFVTINSKKYYVGIS